MSSRAVVVAALLSVLATSYYSFEAHSSQAPNWHLKRIIDSPWTGTETLSISADRSGKVTAQLKTEFVERPPTQRTKRLTDTEAKQFLKLVRAAQLFRGQAWGRDGRPADQPLTTLEVKKDMKMIIIVCSHNTSFDSGPRKDLMDFLTATRDRLMGDDLESRLHSGT